MQVQVLFPAPVRVFIRTLGFFFGKVALWTSVLRRRGRPIVRGDFFAKLPLTHAVAAPFCIEPAVPGFDSGFPFLPFPHS